MQLDISDETTNGIRAAQALAAAGDVDGAISQYRRLLDAVAADPYEGAAVAHMFAIIVDDPREKLAVNEQALRLAEAVPEGRWPQPFFASLYANMGYSMIELGDRAEARRWYEKAARAAEGFDDDEYGRMVRAGIERHLGMLTTDDVVR